MCMPPHALGMCHYNSAFPLSALCGGSAINSSSSVSHLFQALRPFRSSCGIPSTPWYAPRTMPIATARLALSPPTIAFALAAAAKSFMYFRMMYTLDGSVPSVGDALPTLMGSVFPTSHKRAMLVMARSSTNSSLESGRVGSVASSNFRIPLAACFWIQPPICRATLSMAERGSSPSTATFHATLVKNSPPASASSLLCVNMSVLAALAASVSLSNAATAAAERIAMALDMPPKAEKGVLPCTCCSVCLVCVQRHAPHVGLLKRRSQAGTSAFMLMLPPRYGRDARNSSANTLYSP
mmetsp:Transcript_46750/g.108608  ORF Transcript_46750/g.108608 Transcript_46750/m.108608 type:complete len:296 (-) Transcript_46750:305-1192(-)